MIKSIFHLFPSCTEFSALPSLVQLVQCPSHLVISNLQFQNILKWQWHWIFWKDWKILYEIEKVFLDNCLTQTKFNQNLKRMKWFRNEFYTYPPTTLPFCIFFFVFSNNNMFLLSGTSKLSSLSIVTLFSSLSLSSLSSLSPSASEESVWSFESSFEISWRKLVSSFSLFMFSSSDSSSSLGSSSISSVLSEYIMSSLLSFSFASFLISITSCFLLLCLYHWQFNCKLIW